MQRVHRRSHFWLWLLWALLVPSGLVLALLLRPGVPVETQRPGMAPVTPVAETPT